MGRPAMNKYRKKSRSKGARSQRKRFQNSKNSSCQISSNVVQLKTKVVPKKIPVKKSEDNDLMDTPAASTPAIINIKTEPVDDENNHDNQNLETDSLPVISAVHENFHCEAMSSASDVIFTSNPPSVSSLNLLNVTNNFQIGVTKLLSNNSINVSKINQNKTDIEKRTLNKIFSIDSINLKNTYQNKRYVKKEPAKKILSNNFSKLKNAEENKTNIVVIPSNTALLNDPIILQKISQNELCVKKIPNEQSNLQNSIISEEERILKNVEKYLEASVNEDRFDLVGKLYAKKMRCISSKQLIIVEKLIKDVLLGAELGHLDRYTDLTRISKPIWTSTNKLDFSIEVDSKDLSHQNSVLNRYSHVISSDSRKNNTMILIRKYLYKCNKKDRFDLIGKYCADKMRKLSNIQYLYAEILIGKVLLEAELNHLDKMYGLCLLAEPSLIKPSYKTYSKSAK